MKKLLLNIFLILSFLLLPATMAFATKIPDGVLKELKKDFPGVNVRFDGFIELPDKTQYLPVFPVNLIKSSGPVKIKQTIPANTPLKNKPDMILFDNNFALLKIIKSPNAKPTVIDDNNMPLTVKLGILPQDLLVPENLVIPESLRVILGDLVIPIKERPDEFKTFNDFDEFFNINKKPSTTKTPVKKLPSIFANTAPEVKEKAYYITNLETNSVHIVNPETGRDLYQIPVKSIPTDIVQTPDERYLLVSTIASNKLYIIDLLQNRMIKEIEIGQYPSSIAIDSLNKLAYVSNQNSSTISVIDLSEMELINTYTVTGRPSKMILSYDRKKLIYADSVSGKVYEYILDDTMKDEERNNYITQISSLSKFLEQNNLLYIINRNKNQMDIFSITTKKPVISIPVGEKPVDIALIGSEAYVLNAESDSVSVIDIAANQKIKDVPLSSGGFPRRITVLPSATRAFITSANIKEYILLDLQKDIVLKKYPIDISINKVIVSKKYK